MSKRNFNTIALSLALAFSTVAIAADGIPADEYKRGKDKNAAEYNAARSACASLAGNARDICVAEAKGREKVGKAELDASYKPSDKARHAVKTAKAEADYAVAKQKCDDKAGDDKTLCMKEAKAAEASAKASAEKSMAPTMAATATTEKAAAPASKGETPGEYVDDTVITGKVKSAVLGEASLKSAEINVETYKGTVQLTGFVRSRTDIDKAVAVAKSVKGVTAVKNDMIVKGQQ